MEIAREFIEKTLKVDEKAADKILLDIIERADKEEKIIKDTLGVDETRAREIILKEKIKVDIKDLDKEIEKHRRKFKKETLKARQKEIGLKIVK